jgi:hypothetical protein
MRTLMRCAVLAPILVVLGTLTATAAQSNSSKLVATHLLGQYALIKRTIKPHRDVYYDPPDRRFREEGYNLADCGGMAQKLGISLPASARGVTTGELRLIAGLYYKWLSALPMRGYPRESVAPLIQDYEKTLLQRIITKGGQTATFHRSRRAPMWEEGEKLAKKINDLRSRQHLKATPVDYSPDCGGPKEKASGRIFPLTR